MKTGTVIRGILLAGAVASALLSCRREFIREDASDIHGTPPDITAGLETKTFLSPDEDNPGCVYWCSSDRIKVFNEELEGGIFAPQDTNCSVSVFKCASWPGGTPRIGLHSSLASEISCIRMDSTDTLVRTFLNPVQPIYDCRTYSRDASASIGLVENVGGEWTITQMKNLFSLIKFTLLDTSIVRIRMTGAGGETLAGWMDVDYNGGNPTWTEVSGQEESKTKQIVLTAASDACREKNSGRFRSGTDYYIAVLPQTLSSGFSLEIQKEDGAIAVRNIPSGITLKRSTIHRFSAPIDKDLEFSDPEEQFSDPEGPEDLDFSRVGYRWGDSDIPDRPVGMTLGPEDVAAALTKGEFPDTTSYLNDAIASCPSGTALLLKAGEYHIHSPLYLLRSNIVLRGEGSGNTVIVAARCPLENAYSCLQLGPALSSRLESAVISITDEHVPVGAMYVDVENPGIFSRGDNVTVRRKATESWIHDIKMDQIDDPEHPSWVEDIESFNIVFERRVTKVVGTRVYFDNPVPMDLDTEYTVSCIWRSSHNRICESGVEDIGFVAEYDTADPEDEDHAANAVVVRACEHGWVRGVSGKHFKASTVRLVKGARNVTVEECVSLEPVSQITGQRRYAFVIGEGAENCIVKDCTADKDRHTFVSPNRSNGPNVFLRCTGTNCYSNAGPHCYWATLFLYDNVKVDNTLSVEDVGGEAELTSHGWQGANHVLWNCTAPTVVCQSPWATGLNYAYGCVGLKAWGTSFNEDPRGNDPSSWVKGDRWRPDGEWYPYVEGGSASSGRVTPESLYESQLAGRHSDGTFIHPLPDPGAGKDDGLYTVDVRFLEDGHGYSPFAGVEAEKGKAKILPDRTFTLKSDESLSLEFKADRLRLIWGNNNGLEMKVAKGDYIVIPEVSGKVLYSAYVATSSSAALDLSLVDGSGAVTGDNIFKGTSNFYALADGQAERLLFNSAATYNCITRIILKYKEQ